MVEAAVGTSRVRSLAGPLLALVLLGAVAAVAYSNSFSAPFVFDGVGYVEENESLRTLRPWTFEIGRTRPVGFMTFALNYAWGGNEVWGYHAVNLAIHVAAAWLLFDVVRRTLSRGRLAARYGAHVFGIALAVALLWMAHPLQTQSVTYIYQRLESLAGLFYLATLWCFVRGVDSRHPGWWHAASVACCALGAGTKELIVTAPLVVLWYDRAFVASSWRQLFAARSKYYLGLTAVAAAVAVVVATHLGDYADAGLLKVKGVSPLEYAASQPGVILHYLRLSFWPDPLCLDYDWPIASSAADIVPPALAIAALVALTVVCMFRWPAWGFLGGWFFLTFAPTSSIAPIKDLAFEHRMYLPLAALAVIVVVQVHDLLQLLLRPASAEPRPAGRLAWIVPGLLLIGAVALLGWRTSVRNEDYQSAMTIWQDTAQKRPQNARAHMNIGYEWKRRGELDKALAEFRLAKDAKPDDARIYYNLGNAEESLGHFEAAVKAHGKAIELQPDLAEAHLGRANAYAARRQFTAAMEDYNRAIKLEPRWAEAYAGRASAELDREQPYAAIRDFTAAIRLKPDFAAAYLNRGNANGMVRNAQLAMEDFNKAIELKPDFALAYNNRGMLNNAKQLYRKAIEDYDQAIKLNPKYAVAFNNRGNARQALYESERATADQTLAIADRTRAIELNPNYADAYFNRAYSYYEKRDYDRAWSDIAACRKLGFEVNPDFIKLLAKDSGRPADAATPVPTTPTPPTTSREDSP